MEKLLLNLQLFNNTNKTTDSDLSVEMKTYYDKDIIRNAKAKLVHGQFAQKKPIPKNGGKTIEFRKYDPLPKATTPLTEGVTPDGKKMKVTNVTAVVKQYGDYVEISDMLDLTAIDNNIVQANRLLGQQAGETLDTITREVINAGTNVQYADGRVSARYALVGNDGTYANNHYMSCEVLRQAALNLRSNKTTELPEGGFVAIMHPDSVYHLKKDSEWQEAVKYQSNEKIFKGEIGTYDNIRVIDTTEAKIFYAADLTAAKRTLTFASVATKTITVDETLTSADQTAIVGRKVLLKGYQYTVASAGANSITVSETIQGSPADNDIIYPGEAGAAGKSVYSTLVIGADAYAETSVEGGGLQNITKQLGSAGSADPLNQRATTGWKAIHVAEILTDAFMVRVETTAAPNRSGN